MQPMITWPCIESARLGNASRRVPFHVMGRVVGHVDPDHLPLLTEVVSDEPLWRVQPSQVTLDAVRPGPAPEVAVLEASLDRVHRRLHAVGSLRGWRDEPIALRAEHAGASADVGGVRLERAAARWWGCLTLGSHATGYVPGADGRPERLWIARRALDKATDPGKLDNLVGGGVPHGQSPWQTLHREGWEEAGLSVEQMARAKPGRVLRLDRGVPEGWQLEHVHAYELALPAGVAPVNQDGEVSAFECVSVAEAIDLAAGLEMTADAVLVTLEFLLRHRLLDGDLADALQARAAGFGLWFGQRANGPT